MNADATFTQVVDPGLRGHGDVNVVPGRDEYPRAGARSQKSLTWVSTRRMRWRVVSSR